MAIIKKPLYGYKPSLMLTASHPGGTWVNKITVGINTILQDDFAKYFNIADYNIYPTVYQSSLHDGSGGSYVYTYRTEVRSVSYNETTKNLRMDVWWWKGYDDSGEMWFRGDTYFRIFLIPK